MFWYEITNREKRKITYSVSASVRGEHSGDAGQSINLSVRLLVNGSQVASNSTSTTYKYGTLCNTSGYSITLEEGQSAIIACNASVDGGAFVVTRYAYVYVNGAIVATGSASGVWGGGVSASYNLVAS